MVRVGRLGGVDGEVADDLVVACDRRVAGPCPEAAVGAGDLRGRNGESTELDTDGRDRVDRGERGATSSEGAGEQLRVHARQQREVSRRRMGDRAGTVPAAIHPVGPIVAARGRDETEAEEPADDPLHDGEPSRRRCG